MHQLQRGDFVEVFAVYPDRWISRGAGVVAFIQNDFVFVNRSDGRRIVALDRAAPYCSVAVKIMPIDQYCQCLLPNYGRIP